MNRHLSLGVIGHVDHGKTSLVRALTGIDTDRLKEEKERGMSIVLGYAHLTLGDDMIDFIDVPGHEAFIRTMISGATGIDAALLVIDIREGVMPQTIEHLAIIGLIGVRRGVIALHKCDLAGESERAAAVRRMRRDLRGTCLASAPVVFTSARSGEGMEELKFELKNLFAPRMPGTAGPAFYLPVDRAFSMAGRGTVVTGTLRLGRIRVGDEVALMPGGLRSTVRQLEFHRQVVEEAWPGQRIGVNLRHVKPGEVARGDAVASIGLLGASLLLDVRLALLAGDTPALHDGQTVRLLFGTCAMAARVRLLTCSSLAPGESALAQLRTTEPVAVPAGEPFIIRRDSPPMTIGGGRILDPLAVRHRRADSEVLHRLKVLAHGTASDAVAERLKAAGYAGMAISTLAAMCAMPAPELHATLQQGMAVMVDEAHVLYQPFADSLADMLIAALAKFHREYPARAGAPLSYCRASLPRPASPAVFRLVLKRLAAGKHIEVKGDLVRSYAYDPLAALGEKDRKLAQTMEGQILAGGLTPPDVEQFTKSERAQEMLHLLAERGTVLLLPGEHPGRKVVFHQEVVQEAARRLRAAYPPPVQFTVSQARAFLGSTRKFIVPLMEYFDRAGITRRRGDLRETVLKNEEQITVK